MLEKLENTSFLENETVRRRMVILMLTLIIMLLLATTAYYLWPRQQLAGKSGVPKTTRHFADVSTVSTSSPQQAASRVQIRNASWGAMRGPLEKFRVEREKVVAQLRLKTGSLTPAVQQEDPADSETWDNVGNSLKRLEHIESHVIKRGLPADEVKKVEKAALEKRGVSAARETVIVVDGWGELSAEVRALEEEAAAMLPPGESRAVMRNADAFFGEESETREKTPRRVEENDVPSPDDAYAALEIERQAARDGDESIQGWKGLSVSIRDLEQQRLQVVETLEQQLEQESPR